MVVLVTVMVEILNWYRYLACEYSGLSHTLHGMRPKCLFTISNVVTFSYHDIKVYTLQSSVTEVLG